MNLASESISFDSTLLEPVLVFSSALVVFQIMQVVPMLQENLADGTLIPGLFVAHWLASSTLLCWLDRRVTKPFG